MTAGETDGRNQVGGGNSRWKKSFVVGLTSESKGENIHPKQFARRAFFFGSHRENASKYPRERCKWDVYRKVR